MAKITRYTCDFNENLKEHSAVFALYLKDEELASERDTCLKHLGQMVTALAVDNKEVRVVRLVERTALANGAANTSKVVCFCGYEAGNSYKATKHRAICSDWQAQLKEHGSPQATGTALVEFIKEMQ